MRFTNIVRLTAVSVAIAITLGFTATAVLGAIGSGDVLNENTPTEGENVSPAYSHRLIVQLASPAAAAWAKEQSDTTGLFATGERLDLTSGRRRATTFLWKIVERPSSRARLQRLREDLRWTICGGRPFRSTGPGVRMTLSSARCPG